MAEIILSAALQVVFAKLTSAALKKVARSQGIHSQLKKWETSLPLIQDVLVDAAQKEITEKAVKRWLDELRHLAYDMDDVLDELATKAMATDVSGASTSRVRKLIPTCCTTFSLGSTMENKINEISTRLKDLAEAKDALGLIKKEGKSKNMSGRLETTSLVDEASIVGRQGDREALVRMLLRDGDGPCNQNFSIVPIVGMGGIGKTTLARLLYNDAKVDKRFELKAWVCVSDEFDIFKITKVILQSVSGERGEFANLNLLQVALNEKLSGKRFLLVLDDVWSESSEAWRTLALPFLKGAVGSRIIITTRKQQLLTQLGYNQPYRLLILSDDEALRLFAKHALGQDNFESHSTLKSYGEEIVKRCDGLPLALIALGGLLRTKENEEDWVVLLNSEIWRSQNSEDIIPALRLSYYDLPAHLKQLFAYCSLFPKDYVFDKEELVLLWTAEGFLHESAASTSTKSLGHKYFDELSSRSFFERASNEESLYVMHDLMNDLAMFVAGDFFFRLDGEKMSVNGKSEGLDKYRHVSFIRQKYEVYGRLKPFERAKHLRTFLAMSVDQKSWQNFYLSNKTLAELLPQLSLLRVLSLSDYKIKEVPESICSLKHLRYLNLSQTPITHLPEQVGTLFNLQILLVWGCQSLKKLPDSFLKLKNLQHMDISGTPLIEKIDELKSHQTFSKVTIRRDRFAITELKELQNFDKKISIYGLDEVENSVDVANLLQKKELGDLKMEWSGVFDGARDETLQKEVLGVLKPHNGTLRKLEINLYGGVEFPSWVGDPSFQRLGHLTISGCKRCTSLPPLGQLPLLKELVVNGMEGVKVVGSEILGNGGDVAFPSLELLHFEDMEGWESWSTNSGVTPYHVFPCLRELRILGCRNLVEASLEALPSLCVLYIRGCHDVVLTSVVCVAPSITDFQILDISGLNQLHQGVIESLSRVESISIKSCDEMRYLWESEAEVCKILVNLRNLFVRECNNLVGLGDKEEFHCLTSLRQLKIWNCDNLERLSCPNNIEVLKISSCSSITCVSYPTGRPKLKTLSIHDCEKLVVEKILDSSISSIESIYIEMCSNLKLFPDIRSFIHLRTLRIIRCNNLESFPDEQLPCLVSLTELAIEDCPRMEDSFPGGLWPPRLSELRIGGLKKPISEWGQQNFPTSLVDLSINGDSSDDVGTSTQLSLHLPSSLTYLSLSKLEKLESLSTGLQHLTSLQHLYIHNCPNIRDMPETPLPSLLSLRISHCPKLEERYNRRSSRWPLISHIPCITIDYKVI